MTFVTEMTEAGRKLSPPTAEKPAYYLIQASGAHEYGDSGNRTKPPTEEDLRPFVSRAFAAAHYLEADGTGRTPDLMIVYHWGVHAGIDSLAAEISPQLALKNLHQRVRLVGGEKFAARWAKAHNEDTTMAMTNALGAGAVYGIMSAEYRMEMGNPTVRRLLSQSRDDVYFVIATAYDAAALARKERVLLWRTKMTVATQGVAMSETLAPLIAASVPYLGREMDEARPVTRRIYRDGRVILGELEVLDVVGSDAAKSPPAEETHATEPKANEAPPATR